MLVSIEGIYRDGKVELSEHPVAINHESKVIVTFISSDQINLTSVNIDKEQAHDLKTRLSAFHDDWDSPEMDIYNDYEKSKSNLQKG